MPLMRRGKAGFANEADGNRRRLAMSAYFTGLLAAEEAASGARSGQVLTPMRADPCGCQPPKLIRPNLGSKAALLDQQIN